MQNKGVFKLVVETETYKNGISTKDAGIVDDRTKYGLEKLSEALYVSASACAKRHGELALSRRQQGG
jgi:hypothetical protein